jgi:peptide/nickel transport system substrate-binding protein
MNSYGERLMTRRRLLGAGGMSALGMLIASCGGNIGALRAIRPKPAGRPKRGGDLVFATNMAITTLDPAFSQNFSERFAYYAVYNSLVAYDENFNLVPELAVGWETTDRGKSLTLHLRKNVKFHDGTACDAEAVKWNLDRLLDKSTNSPLRGQLTPPLQTVSVVDKNTVRLDLSKPWRPLLAAFGERPGFIVSPTAVEKYGKDYGQHAVGTGPFRLENYSYGSELVMTRFDDYWDPGKPYLDSITIQNVPDQQVQLTMLRTGEAHIMDNLTPQLALTIQNADGIAITIANSGRWYAMQMDTGKPPFDDVRLRQAVAYATDSVAVKNALYRGEARVATNAIGIGWAYDPALNKPIYPLDLSLAKKKIADAGARGMSVRYANSSATDYQLIAQLLYEGYAGSGLDLNVGTVPASDYYNLVLEGKLNWTLTAWTPRADPDGLLRTLFYSSAKQNTTGYKNPVVDKLLDEAAVLADHKAANLIYAQVNQIVARDAPYVWIIWPNSITVTRDNIQGFMHYPDEVYRLRDLWMSS